MYQIEINGTMSAGTLSAVLSPDVMNVVLRIFLIFFIAASWVISPVLSGLVSCILFVFIQKYILNRVSFTIYLKISVGQHYVILLQDLVIIYVNMKPKEIKKT